MISPKRFFPLGLSLLPVMLVLLLGGLGPVRSAEANGAPIRVILSYLAGVSNWGPTGATGVAEVVMGEGEFRVTVTGLPKLEGEVYEAWLQNSTTKESLSVGRFNTGDGGSGKYENLLDGAITDKGYNILILSVAPNGVGATSPGPRQSIAGYLVNPSTGVTLPAQLPRTGESYPTLAVAVAALMTLAAGTGLAVIRHWRATP